MKTKANFLKNQAIQIDFVLLGLTALLILIGLFSVYDSSIITAFRDFGDKLYYFKNQLIWVTFGITALIILSVLDYHKLLKFSPALMIGSIVLLILVLTPFIGTEALGARRWINLGIINFQPSEFAKLAVIFYATSMMTKFNNYKINLSDSAVVYFLPILLATILVTIQPDLGTALIFLAIALVIYFVGHAPTWHFILTFPLLILGATVAIITQPYRLDRLKAFLDPTFDPSGASYQINQIISALIAGGVFGVGIGGAKSKFEFIPEVHNDAIFAVIVEEVGFIGGTLLIAFFIFLILRAIKIAKEAPDFSGKVLAMGIVGLIAIQSLFNFSSIVALVPLTGVPLPLISYGGSSLIVTLASIGILINIKRQS